jgi:uncharacterized DUF497 family protein
MHITDIIWKDIFVEKLAYKHKVSTFGVEEDLNSNPVIRKVGKGNIKGEDVYAAYKQISNGRFLIVIFIKKKGSVVLPISARDMEKSERNYYERQK